MESQQTSQKRTGDSPSAESCKIVDLSPRPSFLAVGPGYRWNGFRLQVKEDVLEMVTYFNNLQGELMKLLKVVGFVNPVRAKARAFQRLQARLFRSTGVQAVAVRGFAKSTRTVPIEYGDDVSVIFSEHPGVELQRDVEKIFVEINRRYGTTMTPVVICRKPFGSPSG